MTIHDNAIKMHNRAHLEEPYHSGYDTLIAGHFMTTGGYEVLRNKGTSDWLLFYTLAGAGSIAHENGNLITAPGDAVLIAPNTRHHYKVAKGALTWEFYWTHFVPWPHWHDFLNWPQPTPPLRTLVVSDSSTRKLFAGLFAEIVHHIDKAHPQSKMYSMNALERALLLLHTINPDSRHSKLDLRIRTSLDILCTSISTKMTLDMLAQASGLSKSRLSHLFIEQIGVTPMEYLEGKRMNQARQLLSHSAFPVYTIAEMCGFESPYYFTRRFSLTQGCSPSAYRTKFRT